MLVCNTLSKDAALCSPHNHKFDYLPIPTVTVSKENETVMSISLRHTSHKLQTMDFTAFRQYDRNIKLALVTGCSQNPRKPVTIYNVASITGKSFRKTFNKNNTEQGSM
jgi:hypothetical protein